MSLFRVHTMLILLAYEENLFIEVSAMMSREMSNFSFPSTY